MREVGDLYTQTALVLIFTSEPNSQGTLGNFGGSRESDSSYRIRRRQKLSLPNSCRILSRLAAVGCVRLAHVLFHEETKCAIILRR